MVPEADFCAAQTAANESIAIPQTKLLVNLQFTPSIVNEDVDDHRFATQIARLASPPARIRTRGGCGSPAQVALCSRLRRRNRLSAMRAATRIDGNLAQALTALLGRGIGRHCGFPHPRHQHVHWSYDEEVDRRSNQ